MNIQALTSRDNLKLKAIKKLAQSNVAYKEAGQIWLEGAHLCDAYLLSNSPVKLAAVVLSESLSSQWLPRLTEPDCEIYVVPDDLLMQISSLPSSGGLGFVLENDQERLKIQKNAHTVILDGIQDAGNVGSILRSSAAFGVQQVLALNGTAALWSSKVLRAAMGAHFSLQMVEDLNVDDIKLDVPILATHVHNGEFLHALQAAKKIPYPCAWVMGHEGQGVSEALLDKAFQRIRIKQFGQESLNVAAAAAVCLYGSMKVD
jgi:RNA methyltransferase, TrmH family